MRHKISTWNGERYLLEGESVTDGPPNGWAGNRRIIASEKCWPKLNHQWWSTMYFLTYLHSFSFISHYKKCEAGKIVYINILRWVVLPSDLFSLLHPYRASGRIYMKWQKSVNNVIAPFLQLPPISLPREAEEKETCKQETLIKFLDKQCVGWVPPGLNKCRCYLVSARFFFMFERCKPRRNGRPKQFFFRRWIFNYMYCL